MGLEADGSGGVAVVIDRNTITHNGTGVRQDIPGSIETRNSNTVRGNATDVIGAPFTVIGGT